MPENLPSKKCEKNVFKVKEYDILETHIYVREGKVPEEE